MNGETPVQERRRHGKWNLTATMLRAIAITTVWAAVIPADAAPVQVAPGKKAEDNLVDPNEEPKAKESPKVDPGPISPALAEKGLAMYKSYCQKCHGIDMVTPGGSFFDLRTFPLDDKQRFVQSVTDGKRAMPAWGSVLKPADIDALWAYVANHQLAKTKP
jgi:mono/diheme cytochrome c family protein